MLFRKYHIVVFKDKQGSCKKFQLRGWFMVTLFLLMVGLTAGNVLLWQKYANHNRLEKGLNLAEKTVQEQHSSSPSPKRSSLFKRISTEFATSTPNFAS